MNTTCPRCYHTRHPNETAPVWQCPACGVAYRQNPFSAPAQLRPHSASQLTSPSSRQHNWRKWALVLAIVCGSILSLYLQGGTLHRAAIQQITRSPQNTPQRPPSPSSSEHIDRLAASIRASDVIMYSTTTCGYCAQARTWLNDNGFAFTECNLTTDRKCEQEFRRYGAYGVPYLVIYGTPLNASGGFSPDAFLAALREHG